MHCIECRCQSNDPMGSIEFTITVTIIRLGFGRSSQPNWEFPPAPGTIGNQCPPVLSIRIDICFDHPNRETAMLSRYNWQSVSATAQAEETTTTIGMTVIVMMLPLTVVVYSIYILYFIDRTRSEHIVYRSSLLPQVLST